MKRESKPIIATNRAYYRRSFYLGVAFLAAGCTSIPIGGVSESDEAAAKRLFSAYPEIALGFYEVPGRDVESIVASMEFRGPIDKNDYSNVYGLTLWNVHWNGAKREAVNCYGDQAKISLVMSVLLPKKSDADRLPPDVAAKWKRFTRALYEHEVLHVENGVAAAAEVRSSLRTGSCEESNAKAGDVVRSHAKRDVVIDKETSHGVADGAHFP